MIGFIYFVGFMLTIFVIAFGVVGFVLWALAEHAQALKWRELLRLHEELKTAKVPIKTSLGGWAIEHKTSKTNVATFTSYQPTEQEALLDALKAGVAPNKILSVKRR